MKASRLEKHALLRYSYILTLVALEEAGKLFELWQAACESENNESDEVVVEGWRNHTRKGGTAGDLCCKMLDFISSLEKPPSAGDDWEEFKKGISESRKHLSEVYPRFGEERMRALYVDFIKSEWTDDSFPSIEIIEVDNLLLNVIARTARTYLGLRDSRFSTPVRLLGQMNDLNRSPEAQEFLKMVYLEVVNATTESIIEHAAEVDALCE